MQKKGGIQRKQSGGYPLSILPKNSENTEGCPFVVKETLYIKATSLGIGLNYWQKL